MPADPYTTLGVNKNASADEIKKAYRKLAHQHHPDKKGGNEAKFKEINEAYQILSDPDKKSRYDRFGDSGGGQYQDFNFDFGGMGGGFENIFDMFSGGGFSQSRQRPEKGEDLHLQVSVSKSDLGKRKVYEFEAFSVCDDCDGTGAEDCRLTTCSACKGQGRVQKAVRTPFGTFSQVVMCSDCGGDGRIAAKKCEECRGAGRIKTKRKLELHIPTSIQDRYLVAFPQEGNAGLEGVPSGDLLVTIRVK
jgi:molecular chaperone DnaJ